MEDGGILIKDIIKSHIQKENELEKQIKELKEELKNAKQNNENSDYFLYKDILNLIIPHLKFEYHLDSKTNIGGYGINIKTPIETNSGYSISLDSVDMPLEIVNELLKEIEKYKEKYNLI